MQLLYGFSNCTDKKYNELMSGKNISILRPDQKYHGLLIKGLAANGAHVKCFSGLPINRALTKKVFIREKDETENGVYYHYINTVNLPVFRRFCIFFGSFFGTLKAKKRDDTYIVCDCLNIANAYGMMLAGKIKKIPIITIVTDIPDMMSQGGIARRINNRFFRSVDGFILLTEQMNARINQKNKPYIVLEGHVDSSLAPADDTEKVELKDGTRQIVYAGSIKKIYGIKNLVEGFILANLDNCELHIYGSGDYAEELKAISGQYSSVKYMGVCDNAEVVKAEQSASLLVNPRPTAPEYTKYSFPSKNMEYMISGTPLLTTRLPGMPEEYYPYVYLLEDETPLGISDVLREIFSRSFEERNEFGAKAREFVLQNKSNTVQAKKIIGFLESELKR
ncbi:MAG: glycosyltransferase family 4 protein [Clostridia bacterium]|nr:glycosyltransferase family 4 protein [Clostridia bacterium]MBR5922774.1 glycosyltransferase family 4 protein [Clostridia bacterium]